MHNLMNVTMMGPSFAAAASTEKLYDDATRENRKKRKKLEKKLRKEKEKKRKNDRHCNRDLESMKPQAFSRPVAHAFDHKYILAPMVGASELAFRLLCRKYGAQLAYTPMMSASSFARSAEYRQQEFQTIPEDRPLVCHFSANNPEDFARAAQICEPCCDAIDLNLGCPQRTAFVGHFGSYLLDKKDRELVLSIVRAGVKAVSIPIFCKIRLLDTIEETIELCRQLRDAGASLIAVHARYRASFERKGPGARDGPAMLDQILEIKRNIPDISIVANGNIITYDDVVQNLELTHADGIMSAEGILDNPALFLPHLGSREDAQKMVVTVDTMTLVCTKDDKTDKKERKLIKKLRAIGSFEAIVQVEGENSINDEQRAKLSAKSNLEARLASLITARNDEQGRETDRRKTTTISLGKLYDVADDKLKLTNEYLALVRRYPINIRTVIFHTRRILKDMLNQYQLMEECVLCQTVDDVESILNRCQKYQEDPQTFVYDRDKASRQKEALERKKHEEGKRKAFEARMIRKAKREHKADLEHYLRIGAEVPTLDTIHQLKSLPKDVQLQLWKKDHSQHCMAFHFDGCKRDRACAFLHTDATGSNTFVEMDEVAG